MHLARLLRKIMYLRPMVIPHIHLGRPKLTQQLLIPNRREIREDQPGGALHHRLTITIECKLRIKTIPDPKLLGSPHKPHILAVPDKHRTLARRTEYKAVSAVVDVQVCGDVEDEVDAAVAAVDVELLLVQAVHFLYSEGV